MEPQEQQHLIQLASGDKESLAFLFRKYQPQVYSYSFKFVRNREIAQEITLDVFLKLWEKRSLLCTDRSISGLLFKMTKDLSISYLRKVSKDVLLRAEYLEDYHQSLENPTETEFTIEEGRQIAQKAIADLPPRCRRVFELRYTEQLSLKQIAEEMDISIPTVKKQLKKGRALVKGNLGAKADWMLLFLFSVWPYFLVSSSSNTFYNLFLP